MSSWAVSADSISRENSLRENVRIIEKDVHVGIKERSLNRLEEAARKIGELYAVCPDLHFDYFKPFWEKVRESVSQQSDSEQERKIISFVMDALKRIESKLFLSLLIKDLNEESKHYAELTKRMHLIYADQRALLPLSSKTYQSEWKEVEKLTCDYPSLQMREYAQSTIMRRQSELDKGYSASTCDIDCWDDSCF